MRVREIKDVGSEDKLCALHVTKMKSYFVAHNINVFVERKMQDMITLRWTEMDGCPDEISRMHYCDSLLCLYLNYT